MKVLLFMLTWFVNMKVQVTALPSFEEKEEQFREQVPFHLYSNETVVWGQQNVFKQK